MWDNLIPLDPATPFHLSSGGGILSLEPRNMGRIGLLGCRLFEEDMLKVITTDDDISEVLVVKGEDSEGLVKKLSGSKKELVQVSLEDRIPIAPRRGSIMVHVKPVYLHQSPALLRKEVTSDLEKMKEFCDAILVFYGLCGNAFRNFDSISERFGVPVMILRDAKGLIVDDCICSAIGGTEEYLNELLRSSNAVHLTPMWAANWRTFYHDIQLLESPDYIEDVKNVFKCMGYKKVVKIENGLGDESSYEKQIDEFSRIFELEKVTLVGNTSVISNSYSLLKQSISSK
jgi:hypothetical protein